MLHGRLGSRRRALHRSIGLNVPEGMNGVGFFLI